MAIRRQNAFPPGFHGFFVDHGLLAGHDFFLGRAEIEDNHQPVQRLFPGDADLAIDLDLRTIANSFGFQNLDVRRFLSLLLCRRGEQGQEQR